MVTQEFTRILEFTQEFSQIFQKKGRKSCNQAPGSITPPAMHCHKQMGLLIYSSGTGFRSVLRHLGVGVCRAPVDTVQETLPNPIFTSIATTRANTLCWEGRDKIPKASRHWESLTDSMEFLEGKLREELIAGIQQFEICHSAHSVLLVPFACGSQHCFSRETRSKFLQNSIWTLIAQLNAK